MQKNIELILVPDVHGRRFWKDCMEYIENGTKVVFLGDYLDPYFFEGYSEDDAVNTFKEILEIAKTHPNVQLLIGNHDCGYMFSTLINDCRTIYSRFDEIRALFKENKGLFKLAVKENIGEKDFLISHAGIDIRWLEEIKDKFFGEDIVENVNSIMNMDLDEIETILGYIPRSRGGFTPYGSCVWQDINDWNVYLKNHVESTGIKGVTQIVGHTMQVRQEYDSHFKRKFWVPSHPVYSTISDVLCIDCQKCYFIDSEGDVKELITENLAIK